MNKIKDFFKSKKKAIILSIIAILIVISGIVSYFLLRNNNKNSDFIIGKTEEVTEEVSTLAKGDNGEYFLNKVNANIKFKVKTEETELKYKIIDEEEKEVETTANKVEDYYEITKTENYENGKTYKIVLENAVFTDEKLKDIKTLGFTIVRPNANTQVLNNEVKKVNEKTITNIEEKENNFTLTSTKEYQKDDIIYYKNDTDIKAFKVDNISKENDNYIINTTTPKLEEIYKELDIYGEFNNNITDFIPNKELEQYVKVSLVKSGILEDLINSLGSTVYASSIDEFLNVEIKPQSDGSVKATITIKLIDGIEGMKNHEMTFEMEMLLKLDTHSEINFNKQDVGANIDIEVTRGLSISPKEEYWEDFKEQEDNNDIQCLEKAKELLKALEEDTIEEEQDLGHIKIPTAVPGLTIDLGVGLVEELKIAFQLNASETTNVNIYFGYKDGINKVNKVGFYYNCDINTTDKKFEALGKAKLELGIEPKVEINFIEVIKIGASVEVGVYAEGQINYSISTEGEENKIDGKAEFGVILEGKLYGEMIGVTLAEKVINEDNSRIPLITISRDLAEEARKAKEEAERKALEEALANVLKGDFSYFAGTYVPDSASVEQYGATTLTLNKDGSLTGNKTLKYGELQALNKKPISIEKMEDGTYSCMLYSRPSTNDNMDNGADYWYYLLPVGVDGNDSGKVYLKYVEAEGGALGLGYYKK